ncbi:MAG: tRNA (adenosine(37)-N6)-threonylcarbamoyltransferase complex ATPase subunit type 1 TsaE [Firmicutes bacterium]|nr:tRNA (adenosine(37)-N6)-threonylcarbamoyltransferase complex ATPase subunit type 1 TsaE [Bacillota bacterium]
MRSFTLKSHSAEETIRTGEALSLELASGDCIGFTGELGAGKTVFIKGIAMGMEITERITSPTFVITHQYKGKLPVYHFDIYRLDNISEFDELGFEEYFFSDGVSLVEWAEKIKERLPENSLMIEISYIEGEESGREIVFSSSSPRWSRLEKKIKERLGYAYTGN